MTRAPYRKTVKGGRLRVVARVAPETRAALEATGSPSATAGQWLDERAAAEVVGIFFAPPADATAPEAKAAEAEGRAGSNPTSGQLSEENHNPESDGGSMDLRHDRRKPLAPEPPQR